MPKNVAGSLSSPDHDGSPVLTEIPTVSVLDVPIANVTQRQAIGLIENRMRHHGNQAQPMFIANAHTINVAHADPNYRSVLTAAETVFPDGTGVRWAARMRGVRLRDNLVGTDLIPALFRKTAGRGYRYFLLGGRRDAVQRAAGTCREQFPGWEQVGYHHGYLDAVSGARVLETLRSARPNLILVGMGNPTQELWIDKHRHALPGAVCVGIGGLLDHWAGNLSRAPRWVRRAGIEWMQILMQQPHKWRRYVIGNPLFVYNVMRSAYRDRQRMSDGHRQRA